MDVLRFAAVALLAGCYAPDAPSCSLACTGDSDCVSDQHCSTDHMCAASGVTTCGGAQDTTDAGTNVGADAGSGSGSGMTTMLQIQVMGGGGVKTNDGDFCDAVGDGNQNCTFTVTVGEAITLTPIPHLTKQFDKWSGMPCMNQPLICTTTATAPMVMAKANFKGG